MLSKAQARFIRMSASKANLVTRLIKGKTVEEAGYILDSINKRTGSVIKKVLDSAFANANFNRQEKFLAKDLIISSVKADQGPMFKRYRAATMGRAAVIRHRTSHVSIELEKAEAKVKTVKKKKKAGSE